MRPLRDCFQCLFGRRVKCEKRLIWADPIYIDTGNRVPDMQVPPIEFTNILSAETVIVFFPCRFIHEHERESSDNVHLDIFPSLTPGS
jgi:hypothetical protein